MNSLRNCHNRKHIMSIRLCLDSQSIYKMVQMVYEFHYINRKITKYKFKNTIKQRQQQNLKVFDQPHG